MRQIETKGGEKWRCIQSIQAAKRDVYAVGVGRIARALSGR
jgi:hypothetical protein